jgi:hypothetical protein
MYQLVRDGYSVEVKKYHVAQGLPSSQIMHAREWLENSTRKIRLEDQGDSDFEGGESLPQMEYFTHNDLGVPIVPSLIDFFQGLLTLISLMCHTREE